MEREYTVPLRKEFLKSPKWKRANKSVKALRDFMRRHMKSDKIIISKEINQELWCHGAKNAPSRIRVKAEKKDDGNVRVEAVKPKIEVQKKVDDIKEAGEEVKNEGEK